jgi:LmbE family N-acetylglucosaminyl deacetylase
VRILAIHAHPDDLEFLVGGTLWLLREEHELAIVTFTPGDCGTAELSPAEISRIRRAEAAKSAALLGASYACLEERDLEIEVSSRTRRAVTEILRRGRPDLVIAASPQDYMSDHEAASACVRDACFNAPVPNYDTRAPDPAPPLDRVPALYYADPVELITMTGEPVMPHFVVDISDVLEPKAELLACHESQRNWLRRHHGLDAYIETMKEWSAQRGTLSDVAYAEGFRQHRGHSYPRDNRLAALLGDRVTTLAGP